MNFSLLKKYPVLKKRLLNQLGYFSNTMYRFKDGTLVKASAHHAGVVIVAKCHYTESWQPFAAVNKKDLQKIIRLKKNSQGNQVFQLFENKNIDGYDVKITTFDDNLIISLGNKTILIPETELYNSQDITQHIYQVETPNGLLFCSGHVMKNISSYAKGVLQSIETYKFSVGLPNNTATRIIPKAEFAHFLIEQLLNQKISSLGSKILAKPKSWIDLKQLHLLYWVPLLTALVFYSISNGYLFIKMVTLESELSQGGEKIGGILSQKKQYEHNVAKLITLSNEFKNRDLVHYYWNIISALIEENMIISRISYAEEKLVVRGTADKASSVLSTLATHAQIESASFQGPVRKSRGKDVFVLEITPKLEFVRALNFVNVQAKDANEGGL